MIAAVKRTFHILEELTVYIFSDDISFKATQYFNFLFIY